MNLQFRSRTYIGHEIGEPLVDNDIVSGKYLAVEIHLDKALSDYRVIYETTLASAQLTQRIVRATLCQFAHVINNDILLLFYIHEGSIFSGNSVAECQEKISDILMRNRDILPENYVPTYNFSVLNEDDEIYSILKLRHYDCQASYLQSLMPSIPRILAKGATMYDIQSICRKEISEFPPEVIGGISFVDGCIFNLGIGSISGKEHIFKKLKTG